MKIVFMGTPDFAVPTLREIYNAEYEIPLVITQPDRKKGRGKKLQPPPVKIIAEELNLRIHQPDTIKNIHTIELLHKTAPDVIVVVAYGQIIPKAILDMPKYGCLNVHASILPKYRGAAPIHWAIINGEKETGVTIMQMDEGLDTGDILAQEMIKIGNNDTMGGIHSALAVIGADLMVKVLKKLPVGIDKKRQENSSALYAPKIERDVERIDWSRSAFEVHNLIRGLNPWPGAYTQLMNENIKIWTSEILCNECSSGSPGVIVGINNPKGIDVQTGKGIVRITELQLPGKKKLQTSEFLKGRQFKEGLSFC